MISSGSSRGGHSTRYKSKSNEYKRLTLELLKMICLDKNTFKYCSQLGFRSFCFAMIRLILFLLMHIFSTVTSFPSVSVFFAAFYYYLLLDPFLESDSSAYDAVLDLVLERIKYRFVDEGRFVCAIENAMALTSDFWTDPMDRSFICPTGSYIDEDWKLHSIILNVSNVTEQHTGDNIARGFLIS